MKIAHCKSLDQCFNEKTLDQCFEEWDAITDKWFDFGTFVDWLKKDGWRII